MARTQDKKQKAETKGEIIERHCFLAFFQSQVQISFLYSQYHLSRHGITCNELGLHVSLATKKWFSCMPVHQQVQLRQFIS